MIVRAEQPLAPPLPPQRRSPQQQRNRHNAHNPEYRPERNTDLSSRGQTTAGDAIIRLASVTRARR